MSFYAWFITSEAVLSNYRSVTAQSFHLLLNHTLTQKQNVFFFSQKHYLNKNCASIGLNYLSIKLKVFHSVNDQFLPNRTRDIIFFTAVTLQETKQFFYKQLTRRCMH